MNIAISPDLQPFVDQLVAGGKFSTPDAAVCDALKHLRDRRAEFEELKTSFEEAIAEYERGESAILDFDEIRRKGQELSAERKRA